ncbi:hypothetical protein [Pseudogemmobacter hezensis]|uniref:hypothetical protein n=1 Tax=Pseudogemmobacter hezensis TaxID=2737662 RepID=UPI001C12EA88|nr:hypothetical protein [Pseudogemmobacter hezensis]
MSCYMRVNLRFEGVAMMLKQSFLAAVLALPVATSPVMATPPDMVEVRDVFFGAGLDEVFVLRSVADNLGSHVSSVSTVFLVAIDTTSGEETLWPVHRSRLQPDESPDSGRKVLEILTDPLAGARNPFDILTERQAMPSGASAFYASPWSRPLDLSGQGTGLEDTSGNFYFLGSYQLFAGLGAAMDRLVGEMEPYGRPGVLGTGDLLGDPGFSGQDCIAEDPMLIRFPADVSPIALMRVTCGDLEDGVRVSLLRVLPMVGQP